MRKAATYHQMGSSPRAGQALIFHSIGRGPSTGKERRVINYLVSVFGICYLNLLATDLPSQFCSDKASIKSIPYNEHVR